MTGTGQHEHCIKCGRRLHCAASKARGYGWGCWRIVRAARKLEALAAFTRQQIEDAAVIPTAVLGLFWTVSSDGTEVYETTAGNCSCPATKACKHNAAVIMMVA